MRGATAAPVRSSCLPKLHPSAVSLVGLLQAFQHLLLREFC